MLRDSEVNMMDDGPGKETTIHQSCIKCLHFNSLPAGYPIRTGFTSAIYPIRTGYTSASNNVYQTAPTYFGECLLFSVFVISTDHSNKREAEVALIIISCRSIRHI